MTDASIVAPLAARLRGLYLAVVTLGLVFIGEPIFKHWRGLTGGVGVGRPAAVPELFGFQFAVDGEMFTKAQKLYLLMLVLLGVAPTDTADQARWLADKVIGLRIFNDDEGKMNRAVADVGGGVLVVSQFTLYGDASKGRRPSFIGAAPPEIAIPLYEEFVNAVKALGIPTATGRFGAAMQVELINDGPVTLILDTR